MRLAPRVAEVRVLGYPEGSRRAPFHPDLYLDLEALLAEAPWARVVITDGIGTPDPNPRDLVSWPF